MNSTVKSIIIFASGAAVGGIGTFLAVKKYYETRSDLEIEEVRRCYEDKLYEIEDNASSVEGDLEGPETIVKEKVRELNNKPDLTDYTSYFKKKGTKIDGVSETLRDAKEAADAEGLSEEELAEMEYPQDDEPYTDEEDRNQTLDYIDHQLNGASRDAIAENRAPYEIGPSDYELTCANYEKQSLIYYHFDQVLADDDENEVSDYRHLIGNILEESGFTDNDDDCLYVRNDKIMVDFEITKLYEAFRPKE